VLAIGQFPPPIHGFSYITRCLSDEVQQLRVVREIDITGSRKARRIAAACQSGAGSGGGSIRSCAQGGRIYVLRRLRGAGTCPFLLVIAAARITGMPTLLHHHSFAYIERRSADALVVGTHPDICHIFLCCTMKGKFEAVYRRGGDGAVLSNAAFVPPDDGASDDVREEAEGLVIGLLSNLTREKGLYRFLELLRVAAERGVAVRGVLAGPVALDEDRCTRARRLNWGTGSIIVARCTDPTRRCSIGTSMSSSSPRTMPTKRSRQCCSRRWPLAVSGPA
jgi:glycosyltransferase involved in cell wall biosynthesis